MHATETQHGKFRIVLAAPPPAEIRRRRLRALGVVAGVAALIGIVVGAGSGDDSAEAPAVLAYCERPSTTPLQLAGQGVVVQMKDTATPRLIKLARSGQIGGVALFPPDSVKTQALAKQIRALQSAAKSGGNPPLLISIDQEGGIVKRLPLLPPQVAPYTLGQNNDAGGSKLEGRATGYQLNQLGINVDLAPVLDVPVTADQFMISRAFGTSPTQVTELGLSFANGLMSKGVAATAKHFPGLGRAVENTDYAPTTITASKGQLRADMLPFRAAIKAKVPMIMVSLASYPALGDAREVPAALSRAVVTKTLRKQLGFRGVVISDDLLAPAVSGSYTPKQAAVEASGAGVDLKLFAAEDTDGIAQALASAAKSGRKISERSLSASCQRVVALKETLTDRTLLGQPATSGSDTQ